MTIAKEYIAYQGDRPLGTGTIRELSKGLGIPYSTLSYSASPSARERSRVRGVGKAILLYEIEKDDEEEK